MPMVILPIISQEIDDRMDISVEISVDDNNRSLDFHPNTESIVTCTLDPPKIDYEIKIVSESKDERQKKTLANLFDDDGFNDQCDVFVSDPFSLLETGDDIQISSLEMPKELIVLPDTTKVVSEKAKSTLTPIQQVIPARKRKVINENICKV